MDDLEAQKILLQYAVAITPIYSGKSQSDVSIIPEWDGYTILWNTRGKSPYIGPFVDAGLPKGSRNELVNKGFMSRAAAFCQAFLDRALTEMQIDAINRDNPDIKAVEQNTVYKDYIEKIKGGTE